jgi:transcriptional regulator with XRE-family HTH domain
VQKSRKLHYKNGERFETVGKWANGKRYPPKDKLLLVSDFLRISIEELMGEEQKEKPSTPEGVDLSSLSPEDAELVRRILGASEAKKNAIRELL